MKKQNFKLLKLKKHKVSKLNMLNKYGGADTETETTGAGTTFYPTMASCYETEEICETIHVGSCVTVDTTKTIGNNSFGESCNGLNTGVGC
ncbi:hypothetical protein H2O64_09515 [Kordia sp. YSTF-M3]|uniref:Uncharacterized protein n=1 Tax=Kordia aestuariivivens TaxID=2759037 RepID=A0ABR7Q8L8_9FLAO|nr:hypothetical protein [Kordia aestuariivivens]MBC8754907.1 hypothetical protein [Kordia aestuariivivens]